MLNRSITIKLLFTVACAGIWPRPAQSQASTYPTVGNVFFVPEENKDFADIIGSPDCPFINDVLAAGGVVLERFYANTHPSIGNYEKVFGGVIETNDDGDAPDSLKIWADNLIRHMNGAGLDWKDYEEDIPNDGYVGPDTGDFATRHDVIPYYSDAQDDPDKDQKILVFGDHFADDLASYNFAKLNYVGANLQHEMHDGSPADADSWLRDNIGPLIDTPQFKANGLLVLWWDEDGSDDNTCPPGVSHSGKDLCGGRTVVVLYGPGVVRAGFSSGTYYMQQSIERMLFGVLGLDPNDAPGGGGNVCTPIDSVDCTPDMTEVFLPPADHCGNGTCEAALGETCGTCPDDCCTSPGGGGGGQSTAGGGGGQSTAGGGGGQSTAGGGGGQAPAGGGGGGQSGSSGGCGQGSATGPGLLALLAVAILIRARRPSPQRRFTISH